MKLKSLFWFIPFSLFSIATLLVSTPETIVKKSLGENNPGNFKNGLRKISESKAVTVANYRFNIFYDNNPKKINVAEKIVWRNLTRYPTKEMYFHFYANAYKSNRTLFASEYYLNSESKTYLNIKSFKLNGQTYKLQFVQRDVKNPYDSTVARVTLPFNINPNDSVNIEFRYSLKIPKSVKRFGYAAGTNFSVVSQWYPKPGIFEKGKWNCHQYFPHLNFYSDFSNFDVSITAPQHFKVAATGVREKLKKDGRNFTWRFVQNAVHDFAWVISDEIIDSVKYFVRKDGSKIKTELFLFPTDEKYIDRIFTTVFHSLDFFEENICSYPYEKVTIVDVPPTSRCGGMEYPTLITVGAQLFSPLNTHSPEKLVAHEFTHQFFYGILANNETEEAWLDEGFTSYFASKIIEKYYSKGKLTFKFLGYIPVYGINYLSFSDIPVVYTLGMNDYPEYSRALKLYYRDLTVGTISDTSYKFPTRLSYVVNSYYKPELMFYVLERLLGEKNFFDLIREYAAKFEFKHPKGKDFWNLLLAKHTDLKWFKNEVFNSTKVFDDRIRYIKKTGKNEYELFAERLGDGYFPHRIEVYTSKDTLYLIWKGRKRYKIFHFKSTAPVVAANLDPKRINLFDVNFSNNSYTLRSRYRGKISLTVRWFFWLQNALMIMGSAG